MDLPGEVHFRLEPELPHALASDEYDEEDVTEDDARDGGQCVQLDLDRIDYVVNVSHGKGRPEGCPQTDDHGIGSLIDRSASVSPHRLKIGVAFSNLAVWGAAALFSRPRGQDRELRTSIRR